MFQLFQMAISIQIYFILIVKQQIHQNDPIYRFHFSG